nr:TRAP transporter substrate-binding protein [Chloroflexota bacterium]
GKKLTLRLSHSMVSGDTALDVFATKLKELAEAKTGGALEIQLFANNVLGQEREVVQQVQQGLVDMMMSGTAIWGAVAPKLQIIDLPFLWRDYDHVNKVMDGEVGQAFTQYMAETAKARPMGFCDSFGFRNVVTRSKEVKTAEDLRGLKLRTIQSPIYVKAIELMEANPTPMAFGEVYTSMQTGVLDGYEHDASTSLATKFYEVAKYLARTQHIHGTVINAVSVQKIDALPADLKKALEDAAREAALYQRGRAPSEDEKALAELKAKGMTINDFDRKPLIPKAEPFWVSYAREVGAEDLIQKIIAA